MAGTLGAEVLILGAGLIGTSVALDLRAAGRRVYLADSDPAHLAHAVQRGAGEAAEPDRPPSMVVLAVPPASVPRELHRLQQRWPSAPFTDVSSAAVAVRRAASALGCDLPRFVSGHPLAGAETSGPAAARAGLFAGRPWFVVDDPSLDPLARSAVLGLIDLTGAVAVPMTAGDHDAAVALVSHVPQVVASALAALLVDAPEGAARLAGPNLRGMTRVAASSPALWMQILGANAGPVAQTLRTLITDLNAVAAALERVEAEEAKRPEHELISTPDEVEALLRRGNAGRARLG